MDTLPQEEPTKLLQALVRPSVYRRLNVVKSARGLKSISPVVDEILDRALPALPAGTLIDDIEDEPAQQPDASAKKRRAS